MFWSLGALVQKKKGFYAFLKNIFHTLFEKKEKKQVFFMKEFALLCVRLRSLSRLSKFFKIKL